MCDEYNSLLVQDGNDFRTSVKFRERLYDLLLWDSNLFSFTYLWSQCLWNHKREELGLSEYAKHVNYAGRALNDMNSRSQMKFLILLDTVSHYKLYFLKAPSHTGQALQNNFLAHNWASHTSTDLFLEGGDGNGEGDEI